MRTTEDGRLSANIGTSRKERIKRFASERFNGNMTAAINAAIDAMTEDEARERASIPPHIKDAINYVQLILRTGTPAQDWPIIQMEVEKLWKSMLS